jgi:hypothetical protein
VNKTGSKGLFIHKLFNIEIVAGKRSLFIRSRPEAGLPESIVLERDCAISDLKP